MTQDQEDEAWLRWVFDRTPRPPGMSALDGAEARITRLLSRLRSQPTQAVAEVTPAMIDAFIKTFHDPAPLYEGRTNSVDRMRLLAANVIRAVLSAEQFERVKDDRLAAPPVPTGDGA